MPTLKTERTHTAAPTYHDLLQAIYQICGKLHENAYRTWTGARAERAPYWKMRVLDHSVSKFLHTFNLGLQRVEVEAKTRHLVQRAFVVDAEKPLVRYDTGGSRSTASLASLREQFR